MLGTNQTIIADGFAVSDFLSPRHQEYGINESYERGGVALFNARQGLTDFIWHAWIGFDDSTGKHTIYIKRQDLPDDTKIAFLADDNIMQVDLAFDQNMNPCLAYVANNIAKLYFYDTKKAQYVALSFAGITNPRVSLDDKRAFNIANSNIIFAYMRDKTLCMRLQIDRFTIEYHLKTFECRRMLWRIGMGNNSRFLFYMR